MFRCAIVPLLFTYHLKLCYCATVLRPLHVQERGAGYWLWKPYIILKTLLYEMEEGDLLLYSDSGSEAIGDLRPLFDLAVEDDIVIFKNPPKWVHREKQWTKPDAFVIMGCPVEQCGSKVQVRIGLLPALPDLKHLSIQYWRTVQHDIADLFVHPRLCSSYGHTASRRNPPCASE